MKLPAHVLFRKEVSLILWKPRGVLNQSKVNAIIAFIETVEKRNSKPLNRVNDLSALDAVDLNFDFVFRMALGRRLSAAPKPAVKSAFYVTSEVTTHYANSMPCLPAICRSTPLCSRIALLQRSGSAFLSRHCPNKSREIFGLQT
jgi:hypothetical protein